MYSIRNYINVPEIYLDELFDLFEAYANELKEDHLTYENLCEMANDFGVNIFFSGKKMAGFYLASKEMTPGRIEICFIHHIFIAKDHRRTKLIELAEDHMVATAKSMGVMEIYGVTLRNANAFMGLFSGKWSIHSTTIKLSI